MVPEASPFPGPCLDSQPQHLVDAMLHVMSFWEFDSSVRNAAH